MLQFHRRHEPEVGAKLGWGGQDKAFWEISYGYVYGTGVR